MAMPAVTLEFPDLPKLAEQFRKLPKSLASAAIGAGIKRAMQPAQQALKRTTPVGPTGNLLRGIATKAKRYTKTGVAVVVVGYRKPGAAPAKQTKRRNRRNNQTFHQFLVEFGTKERRTASGASRGAAVPKRPIKRASDEAAPKVQANMVKEMTLAYENALKQLPRYMAARAAKGRS